MDSIQSFYNSDSKKLTQLNPPSRYHTYVKKSHLVLFHLLLLLSSLSVSDFFILTIVVAASYTQNLPGNQETYHSSVEPTQLVSACFHLMLKISQFTESTWKAFYNTCFRLYLYLCLFGRVQVPGGLHDVCLGLQQQREQGVEGIARQLDRAHRLRSHRQPLQAFARGPGCLHGRISQEDHANIQIFLISKSTKSILQVTSLASLPGQYGNGTYSGQHQHRDKYPAKKRVHAYGESNSLLEVP